MRITRLGSDRFLLVTLTLLPLTIITLLPFLGWLRSLWR